MIRVLQIVSSMNRAGIENALMNYYRNIDREQVQFDFLVAKESRGAFDDEIESLGGKIYRIPMSNPVKYLMGLNKFFRHHKEYDICHLHHLPWGSLTLPFAKLHGLHHRISHVHFAKDTNGPLNIKLLMRKIGKSFSTEYMACGRGAGEYYFGTKIIESDRFRVLLNAIESDKFDFNPSKRNDIRRKLGINEECFVIGQVARLRPVKNHKFTIDILSRLKNELADVKLIIVGDGELEEELKSYTREKGVEENCIFTGAVENPYDYMQAMDFLIFPSEQEGLGLVAIEAQTSGLKTLASTGVPVECKLTDLVSFLCLTSGPDRWAEKILEEKDYERRGRTEYIRVAGYDAKTAAGKLQEFYLNLSR